jgi:hypothetical protein
MTLQQEQAQETIRGMVRDHCLALCERLTDDFKRVYDCSTRPAYKFYIESGRKYHKLIMETGAGSRSVHAFVDQKSGEVFKAASFKAPAKGVRYNLLSIESRQNCLARADWAGGYLYIR